MRSHRISGFIRTTSVESFTDLRGSLHSELPANLLIHLGANSAGYSECALITLKVLADFDSTIRRFDPSRPSQPVPMRERLAAEVAERPTIAGFCDLVNCLQAPEFTKSEATMPKVSGYHCEYSRFRETDARDRV